MRRLITLFLLLVSTSFAQRIYVQHEGDDLLGKRFAFAFKEAINKSSTYSLADSPGQTIEVTLATMDPAKYLGGNLNGSVVVGVVVALNSPVSCPMSAALMHQQVTVAREAYVDEYAKNLLADVDEVVSRWRRKLKESGSISPEVDHLLAPKKN